ncbi:uncharacterized protein VTP21DRAFT_4459 [Calcarisporiella thermophila]|uniref:uncharacterized protein n=1 Tax=Calcarisporiella thermophila TaxID=911321 RepID=UPI003743874F
MASGSTVYERTLPVTLDLLYEREDDEDSSDYDYQSSLPPPSAYPGAHHSFTRREKHLSATSIEYIILLTNYKLAQLACSPPTSDSMRRRLLTKGFLNATYSLPHFFTFGTPLRTWRFVGEEAMVIPVDSNIEDIINEFAIAYEQRRQLMQLEFERANSDPHRPMSSAEIARYFLSVGEIDFDKEEGTERDDIEEDIQEEEKEAGNEGEMDDEEDDEYEVLWGMARQIQFDTCRSSTNSNNNTKEAPGKEENTRYAPPHCPLPDIPPSSPASADKSEPAEPEETEDSAISTKLQDAEVSGQKADIALLAQIIQNMNPKMPSHRTVVIHPMESHAKPEALSTQQPSVNITSAGPLSPESKTPKVSQSTRSITLYPPKDNHTALNLLTAAKKPTTPPDSPSSPLSFNSAPNSPTFSPPSISTNHSSSPTSPRSLSAQRTSSVLDLELPFLRNLCNVMFQGDMGPPAPLEQASERANEMEVEDEVPCRQKTFRKSYLNSKELPPIPSLQDEIVAAIARADQGHDFLNRRKSTGGANDSAPTLDFDLNNLFDMKFNVDIDSRWRELSLSERMAVADAAVAAAKAAGRMTSDGELERRISSEVRRELQKSMKQRSVSIDKIDPDLPSPLGISCTGIPCFPNLSRFSSHSYSSTMSSNTLKSLPEITNHAPTNLDTAIRVAASIRAKRNSSRKTRTSEMMVDFRRSAITERRPSGASIGEFSSAFQIAYDKEKADAESTARSETNIESTQVPLELPKLPEIRIFGESEKENDWLVWMEAMDTGESGKQLDKVEENEVRKKAEQEVKEQKHEPTSAKSKQRDSADKKDDKNLAELSLLPEICVSGDEKNQAWMSWVESEDAVNSSRSQQQLKRNSLSKQRPLSPTAPQEDPIAEVPPPPPPKDPEHLARLRARAHRNMQQLPARTSSANPAVKRRISRTNSVRRKYGHSTMGHTLSAAEKRNSRILNATVTPYGEESSPNPNPMHRSRRPRRRTSFASSITSLATSTAGSVTSGAGKRKLNKIMSKFAALGQAVRTGGKQMEMSLERRNWSLVNLSRKFWQAEPSNRVDAFLGDVHGQSVYSTMDEYEEDELEADEVGYLARRRARKAGVLRTLRPSASSTSLHKQAMKSHRKRPQPLPLASQSMFVDRLSPRTLSPTSPLPTSPLSV